ncbi:probable Rds1 protein [Serendipita indica DSM 11827]|uniref:Probable Rds1 protein n=1 Tax=Serendipita indica (strain DSM 11827) TaxID=1109443 RepID=G4TSU4_SERID|nr:probable Rds1 protein [Serendipita indica DSM 11827]
MSIKLLLTLFATSTLHLLVQAAPWGVKYSFFKRGKFDAFGWTLPNETSNDGKGDGPMFNPIPSTFNPNPVYRAETEFDVDSLQVGLHQEYLELDLFNWALVKFSEKDFTDYGLSRDEIHLISFFAQQEIGHAEVLSNMIGENAAKPCKYRYNFNTVGEFFDFSQRVTRYGESGVYGFLPLLENRAVAQILLQAISTEARQQFAFRQLSGLFPVTQWFETGATQAMQWTLLSQNIISCPPSNFRKPVVFPIYPRLNITNNPNPIDPNHKPAIASNRTALTAPGRRVTMNWQDLGVPAGPYNQVTSSNAKGGPKFAAWLSQYNVTYSPLENIRGQYAETAQPDGMIFKNHGAEIINGTIFLMVTDTDLFVTPANLSLINDHIVAGPALYVSG